MKGMKYMNRVIFVLGTVLVFLLVGCSSKPVALAPVGPDPFGFASMASTGTLQVFSRQVERSDDLNQGADGLSDWRKHTGYDIYSPHGNLVRHVRNAPGYYSESPERISLPAGRYLVRAQAKGNFWVEVPVTIRQGRTTRVHLDDRWEPARDVASTKIVTLPDGYAVGWRTEWANGNKP